MTPEQNEKELKAIIWLFVVAAALITVFTALVCIYL